MKTAILGFLVAFALYMLPVASEIERVTVTWTAMECQANCIKQLEQQFRKIPGVGEVIMNPSAGQVDLKWKKNATFSFSPVNIAMELIGLTINDIRVRVHGTLKHSGNSVTLISSGDGTQFNLLNPVVPQAPGQTPQFNAAARGLRPELLEKLIKAEQEKKEATIEGPLLFPERSPPLQLVVSISNFTEPKKSR